MQWDRPRGHSGYECQPSLELGKLEVLGAGPGVGPPENLNFGLFCRPAGPTLPLLGLSLRLGALRGCGVAPPSRASDCQ